MKPIKNIVVAVALGLFAASVAAQGTIGVVKRSKGEVVVERGDLRVRVVKGTELLRGDRLVTSQDGYAYVQMRGATPIAIGPDTQVTLDRFASDENRVAHRSAPRLLQGIASYLAVNRHR
jgi:hypothetical protein